VLSRPPPEVGFRCPVAPPTPTDHHFNGNQGSLSPIISEIEREAHEEDPDLAQATAEGMRRIRAGEISEFDEMLNRGDFGFTDGFNGVRQVPGCVMGVLSWWAWLCVARQAHQQAGHKLASVGLVVRCTPGKQAGHKLASVGLVVRCTPGTQAGWP
jgi:hypothetical protein